jgi:hypothetical protein
MSKHPQNLPTTSFEQSFHARLLGAGLEDDLTSRAAWVATFKAALGEPLTDTELEIFTKLGGGRAPPIGKRISELYVVAGRGGGKSQMSGACAVYAAVFMPRPRKFSPGELVAVQVLAPTREQARSVMGFVKAFLGKSKYLSAMIVNETAESVTLSNGVLIEVTTANFRTAGRSRSLLCCIIDEAALLRDDTSALADVELVRAVRPALGRIDGLLIVTSSAYRKVGLMWDQFQNHFGKNDPNILVVQGTTLDYNPTFNKVTIESAFASDPIGARAEYGSEFRGDLSSYLDEEVLTSSVNYSRPMELPPVAGRTYYAFMDPSGLRGDSFCLALAHREGDKIVIDLVRGTKKGTPDTVVNEYVALAREYKCSVIHGDNYGADLISSLVEKAGVIYKRCDLDRNKLFIEAIPQFMRGGVELPNHEVALTEFRLLERHPSKSGQDKCEHPRNAHDDHANAIVGVMWAARDVKKWELPSGILNPVSIRKVSLNPEASPHLDHDSEGGVLTGGLGSFAPGDLYTKAHMAQRQENIAEAESAAAVVRNASRAHVHKSSKVAVEKIMEKTVTEILDAGRAGNAAKVHERRAWYLTALAQEGKGAV